MIFFVINKAEKGLIKNNILRASHEMGPGHNSITAFILPFLCFSGDQSEKGGLVFVNTKKYSGRKLKISVSYVFPGIKLCNELIAQESSVPLFPPNL